MYIDSQQDAENGAAGKKTGGQPRRKEDQKKSGRAKAAPLKKNSQNAFAHQRKEIQMLRNHASTNIGSTGFFVNGLVTLVSLILIGSAYFSAVGQFVA